MIKCDYILERDMGNGNINTYKPKNIPSEVQNVAYIEGPNSSGKSTFLNILALSMYGNKNKKINLALQKKLTSLLNSEYQKLSFEVEIENKDSNLKIYSKKELGSQEINVFESINGDKGKPLSPETFENKYNLIYDIPSNPTDRLKEFIAEIREDQQRYGIKIAKLGNKVNKIIGEISEARGLDRLDYLRKQLDQMESEKKILELDCVTFNRVLSDLEKYACYEYYMKYYNSCRRLSKMVEDLEKDTKKEIKTGKKSTNEYHSLKYEIERTIGKIDDEFKRVTPILINLFSRSKKNRLEIWKRIHSNLYDSIDDYYFPDDFGSEIAYFNNELIKVQMNEASDSSLKEAKVVSELVDFLKGYEYSNFTLPGVNITLRDFIGALENKNKQDQKIIQRSKNVVMAKEALEKMDKLRKGVENELLRLKRLAEEKVEDADSVSKVSELKKQSVKYRKQFEQDNKKFEFYKKECIAKNINISVMSNEQIEKKIDELKRKEELLPYIRHEEQKLHFDIEKLKIKLKDIEGELREKKVYIKERKSEIDTLESKEPHRYENYLAELTNLYKKIEYIRKKFCDYHPKILTRLQAETISKDEIDNKFFSEISKYLAKRIGTFRHIDTEYEAKVVDLISRQIITEDDQIIRFDDMGTGQSQSAYLTGLLNTKDDSRKVIALFDEVAMMDTFSLEPIYRKLKELYQEDRLLVGIVVQKADSVRVISKI